MQSLLLEKEGLGTLGKLFSLVNMDKIASTSKDNPKDNKYIGGSISEYSKDMILTFPVLCDNSLPASTASMISRANERNIIAMLQMLFASNEITANSGKEVIASFHKNINTGASIYDVIDTFDDLSNLHKESLTPEVRDKCKAIIEAMKTYNPKSFPVESLNETSLQDYLVYNTYRGISVLEAAKNEAKNDNAKASLEPVDPRDGSSQNSNDRYDPATNKYIPSVKKQADEYDNDQKYKAKKNDREERQDSRNAAKDRAEFFSKVLLDGEVKKNNELAPSLMLIRYKRKATDGSETTETFVAGVKSRLISVDALDIVERLAAKNKTRLNFTNLIRATTGEINFISDFILCTKQAKIDAKNAVKKGPAAKMWNVLEYRGGRNSKHKLLKSGNDASAITTLCINQETVNALKKSYGFDVENIRNAKMIMEVYNLLAIIICDESIEVAKILYAGNDLFEQQAYTFLEKEGKDSSYKKIVDLLNKGRY